MVEAYFSTFTVYGFWLPNDPRGSGSVYVGSKSLLPYGLATKVQSRRSVAWRRCDPVIRREAKLALKYPPVQLNGSQALHVALAFADVLRTARCATYACAILPDHVHFVIARPRYSIEQLINRLKGAATVRLRGEGLHPFQDRPVVNERLPKMWGRGDWNVHLSTPAEIIDRIGYVRRNPLKQGLPEQHWSFVVPYVEPGP